MIMDTVMDVRYLVGLSDIARLHGVGKSTAQAWRARADRNGMPPPVCTVAMGPLWDLRAVAGWHRNYEVVPHGPRDGLTGRAPLASEVNAWRDRV
jgi:hypothetical protein